jgi:hypothetical protein
MKIGSTDPGEKYANLDIVDADFRFRNFFEPKTALRPALY